jgi:putative transcriptional regulator
MRDILTSAREAIGVAEAIVRGGGDRWEPPSGEAIKRLRKRLGNLSQSQFARKFGLDLKSLQQWEQERRSPEQVTCLLLSMIEEDSRGVERLIQKVRGRRNVNESA